MKTLATCRSTELSVSVSLAKVYLKIFAEGSSLGECSKSAETKLQGVLADYNDTMSGICPSPVVLSSVRCVNGDRSICADFTCDFEINGSLANCLVVLDEVCSNTGSVELLGWDAYPSPAEISEANKAAALELYQGCVQELQSLAQLLGEGSLNITGVRSNSRPKEDTVFSVVLPDVSCDERSVLFQRIEEFLPKAVTISKTLSVSATY